MCLPAAVGPARRDRSAPDRVRSAGPHGRWWTAGWRGQPPGRWHGPAGRRRIASAGLPSAGPAQHAECSAAPGPAAEYSAAQRPAAEPRLRPAASRISAFSADCVGQADGFAAANAPRSWGRPTRAGLNPPWLTKARHGDPACACSGTRATRQQPQSSLHPARTNHRRAGGFDEARVSQARPPQWSWCDNSATGPRQRKPPHHLAW